jgi:TDG/mug DNA glycosylase family protein
MCRAHCWRAQPTAPPRTDCVRFTRAELESFRDATLPDLLGPGVRLLFVGINPGLWTVAVQAHFGRRGNRFYPALALAAIVDHLIDASAGFSAADETALLSRGIGITNLVARATARADELAPAELVAGAERLTELVRQIRPRVVAILGITAYRKGFDRPRATAGRQPEDLGDSQLWVVPNPSGLNAHSSLAALAAAYREVALAAGISLSPGAGSAIALDGLSDRSSKAAAADRAARAADGSRSTRADSRAPS